MSTKLFTCVDGTVVDLSKVCAVHSVTDEHNFLDASWTYQIIFQGESEVNVGSDDKAATKACHDTLIDRWQSLS